jgi:hypothetical protein
MPSHPQLTYLAILPPPPPHVLPVQCPSAPIGYILSVGKDRPESNIACSAGIDINSALAECNDRLDCKAFSLVIDTGEPRRCTKSAALPLSPAAGNFCFYTKMGEFKGAIWRPPFLLRP